MADTDTSSAIQLTTLRSSDAAMVRHWLRGFLSEHNRSWVGALGLGWTVAETDVQMIAADLVERQWAAVHRASRSTGELVAVARLDERPIGCVWAGMTRHDYLQTPLGVLHWVYVAHWARRHGVGMALIEAAKEWMRMREARGVQVSVLAQNEAAIALYARAGLTIADHRMMGSLE